MQRPTTKARTLLTRPPRSSRNPSAGSSASAEPSSSSGWTRKQRQ